MQVPVCAAEREAAPQGREPGPLTAVLEREAPEDGEAGEFEMPVVDLLDDRAQLLQVRHRFALVSALGEDLGEREPAQRLEIRASDLDRHAQGGLLLLERAHEVLAQHRLPAAEVVEEEQVEARRAAALRV